MTQEEAPKRALEIAQAYQAEAPALAAMLTSVLTATAAGGESEREMVVASGLRVVASAAL